MKRRRLLLAVPAVLALGLSAFAWAIDAHGHAQLPRRADAIVVLGAGVLANGRPSHTLRERVAHAVALHRAGWAPAVLMTGGVGVHPPSEALAAAELARKMGVPASQVLVEGHSASTRENALFAARICRERGWKSVVLVSQPFHLWRARRLFEREGLNVSASPVPNARVDELFWTRAAWSLREAVLGVRDGFF